MKKKIRFQQLEARVLLDAAGLATAADSIDDSAQLPEDQGSGAQDHSTDELDAGLVAHLKGDIDGKDSVEASPLMIESTALVVVDTTIENFESLISDLSEDTEILFLEGDLLLNYPPQLDRLVLRCRQEYLIHLQQSCVKYAA